MVRQRVRIHFSKSGLLRYIGHQDTLRTLERLFRRAAVPLAMSQGFHPKPKISSPSALALGVAGLDEVIELELDEAAGDIDLNDLLRRLNARSIRGLDFLSASLALVGTPKARLEASVYALQVPEPLREATASSIERFLAGGVAWVCKSNGKSVDVRPAVVRLTFSPETGTLEVELLANKVSHNGPEVGIREFLTAIDLEETLFKTVFPVRIRTRLAETPS